MSSAKRPTVGISACLLGDQVRFDGGHARDRFVMDRLSRFLDFVPVCPEVEIGLGTPRETLRLVQDPAARDTSRLVAPRSGEDHTKRMREHAARRAAGLRAQDLSGFILKRASPSCGMERVKVYKDGNLAHRKGQGLFAEALAGELPWLPLEEEGRLCDPRLRAHFCERVFAHHRVQQLFAGEWTRADVVRFHTSEKLQLLAHHRPSCAKLGALVAQAKELPRHELACEYTAWFQSAMSHMPTRGTNMNVLQHMAGYFKKLLSGNEKSELHGLLSEFHNGWVPLIAPVRLIRYLARAYDMGYLQVQSYLQPAPGELTPRAFI